MAPERKSLQRFVLLLAFFFFAPVPLQAGCPPSPLLLSLAGVARISYTIQRRLPHDTTAFTQGLLFADGLLYESTGRYGDSSLRLIDPRTGSLLKNKALPPTVFGEGLALADRNLVQLTWKEHQAYVYHTDDFTLQKTMTYEGEGWGLTAGDKAFFMSDGSPVITIRSLADFTAQGLLKVHAGSRPFARINELELARNALYANVWQQDVILRIDPASGAITGYVDISDLTWPGRPCGAEEEVANGIAYDAGDDIFFLTGKNWPYIFVVRFSE